jgi:hypothetical protein
MSKDPKALLPEDQLIERILPAALRAHGHRGILPRT